MGRTANPTIVEQFRDRRRIYAILVGSGFLVGAVADARPCPYHELLPEFVSAQPSAHGERGHDRAQGVAHAEDERDGTSDVHECLCVDICKVDGASAASPSTRVGPEPVGAVEVRLASAKQVFHPHPTAVLIQLPNAPPA